MKEMEECRLKNIYHLSLLFNLEKQRWVEPENNSHFLIRLLYSKRNLMVPTHKNLLTIQVWQKSELACAQCFIWRRQWHPTPVLLAWRIPWTEEPGGRQSIRSLRVRHNWATSFSLFTLMHWRHQFANKGPSSQRYGFASSHTQMWKLDHKEGWELKNWCFRTVMPAKMDIKPVNLKGYQPWTFIGKTDAEAPIHWAPDAKSQLIGKNPDARQVWGQKKKEATEDEMAGWHHQLNRHGDMDLRKLREIVKEREA